MNKKLLTSLVAVLICISLISAGYSAWLIIKVEGVDDAQAQFKVHTVQTKELQFEAVVLGETGKAEPITLGKPNPVPDTTYTWATLDGEEDLDFTLQITLKPLGQEWSEWKKEATTFRFWLTEFAAGSDKSGTYLSLPMGNDNADNYIDVTCTASGACTVAKSGLNKNGTVTISNGVITIPLSLAWGSAFEGSNPYEYFNSKPYNSDKNTGFAAKANALKAIKNFSITVNGSW